MVFSKVKSFTSVVIGSHTHTHIHKGAGSYNHYYNNRYLPDNFALTCFFYLVHTFLLVQKNLDTTRVAQTQVSLSVFYVDLDHLYLHGSAYQACIIYGCINLAPNILLLKDLLDNTFLKSTNSHQNYLIIRRRHEKQV